MTKAFHDDTIAALAAPDTTRTAPLPRIKFSPRGFAIDHPDRKAGERLMAEALGAGTREAMHGLLTQLVKASVVGQKRDKTSLGFMLAMVRTIAPRDALEAMLTAQMVSVHVMAMRCAHRLASAADAAQQDSAARALSRLARTFPAQMEALSRHRARIAGLRHPSADGGDRATRIERVIVMPGDVAGDADAGTIAPGEARDRQSGDVDATQATGA